MAQKQPDKELWLLYYFVMWGDENGFHSHQFKNASRSFESEEKRKASALLKLVPGLTGNFEHQLFLRDYVVESLKNRPGKPLPVKVAANKISRAAKESRRPPYLYQSLFRFSSSRCCCFSLNRSSSRCFSRSLSNCLCSASPMISPNCSDIPPLPRGDCSRPGACS
jgi:hypothetical protein